MEQTEKSSKSRAENSKRASAVSTVDAAVDGRWQGEKGEE